MKVDIKNAHMSGKSLIQQQQKQAFIDAGAKLINTAVENGLKRETYELNGKRHCYVSWEKDND